MIPVQYAYMTDRKKPQYVTLYVNHVQHAVYSATGHKRFSAVMIRKTTAQSVRYTKFVDLLEFGGLQTPKTAPFLATGLN